MDYKEIRFEEDIVSFLINKGGFARGDMQTYDKERAIDMEKFVSFIKATQPKAWKRYEDNYKSDVESRLYKRFNESVEMHGLLRVLREGFMDRGVKIDVAYFKPESTLNPDVIRRYNQNILTCARQFRYSKDSNKSIDMVLSLNGIPIVAIELKNQITGQSVDNGIRQFMYDRDPRERCFYFNNRFLVYFAVDLYEVYMTTHLKGKKTSFLPFNQGSMGAGNDGGAGNPKNPEGYATSYLWEDILTKDTLMDIIQKYMHLHLEDKSKKLIFPRYHQLDVVRKLLGDVKSTGSGKNYLVQHSAGSGKSNSIAWLAYGLASLHDVNNVPIFTSTIIVSDRKVLDNQLQETISSFDHTPGVLETIGDGKTSKDLLEAVNNNIKIIVTTLQKFPVIYQDVDETRGKRFAIIVDEAHQSQSGTSAKKLKKALADTEDALREFMEIEGKLEEEIEEEEDRLLREIVSQGKHKNLSFFAFTATPKRETLELFGEQQGDGRFTSYHTYSMRQAIEEGFILDVLKNYMTYETCYKIAKNTEDNPQLPTRTAVQTIRRFATLHPYTLGQKTAIMVEQFRENTRTKIGGRAKAMVVTPSRLHALRYYHEFKRYIESKGYDEIEILIAFSGVVQDGEEYTEEGINRRKDGTKIREKQLPAEFASDNFNVLIVAEKYQTGFDEPLLHTMFVDKKLKGVKAVQTLSRLNRIYPDKEDTFILDFVNSKEEIEEAFAPFYRETILDEGINVNLIYDTSIKLRDFKIYNDKDIKDFSDIYFKKGKQTSSDLGKMTSLFKPVIARYEDLEEEGRFEFKETVGNFIKWYSYIAQIVRMYDMELHKEYVFASYLSKLLLKRTREELDLENKLSLEFFKLEETFKGSIVLDQSGKYEVLVNPKTIDTEGGKSDEEEFLEEIIKKVNEKYKGRLTDADKVIIETLSKRAYQGKLSKKLRRYANKNNVEVFEKSIFPDIFKELSQECYMESVESYGKLFEDREFYDTIMAITARSLYSKLRKE